MEAVTDTKGRTCAPQACDRCKVRKKRCDKLLPCCTACKKKLIKCSYEEDKAQLEILRLRSQLGRIVNRSRRSFHGFLPSQMHIDPTMSYPIPSRWYMPFLVNHYSELQFPSFARNGAVPEACLKDEWMQASLSDPCIFHSILFAASSHLDVLRGEIDNPVTHYHRQHATRLLLDHISSSCKISVTAVATAMYLWHYETMSSHVKEGNIHKQGLQQMIKANGGLNTIRLCGDRLSNLIMLIDIGDSILNATQPIFSVEESCRPLEAPVSLVSIVLRRCDKTLHKNGITESLISLLKAVHAATLSFEGYHSTDPLEEVVLVDEFETGSALAMAIRFAAMIHFNSLQSRIMFSSDHNQPLVENLRSQLASLPQGSDNEIENEIYVFLCFTGAATARKNREWFLAKVGPVVMSFNQRQLHSFKVAITNFCAILHMLAGFQDFDGSLHDDLSY